MNETRWPMKVDSEATAERAWTDWKEGLHHARGNGKVVVDHSSDYSKLSKPFLCIFASCHEIPSPPEMTCTNPSSRTPKCRSWGSADALSALDVQSVGYSGSVITGERKQNRFKK